MELPDTVLVDMKRVKAYYPYRIVFAAFEGETWNVYAKTTKHVMNRLLREGITVWKL